MIMVYATMMLCWKDGCKTRCKFKTIWCRTEMPIAYCFRFCCHFCHFTFDINLLSINPLREVLKVTATKNKNKLEVLNPIRSLEPKHFWF